MTPNSTALGSDMVLESQCTSTTILKKFVKKASVANSATCSSIEKDAIQFMLMNVPLLKLKRGNMGH